MLQRKKILFLVLVLILGIFLRFYNLNWGAPYYFHPDERNIATAVAQLRFPEQMNPNFFAYGSLPIYAIYFTGLINIFFTTCHLPFATCHLPDVSFEHAIVISRVYSALFSTLLIPLLFLIGKRLKDAKAGILAAFLATFSVGFIQFAHFGTFEMWLTLLGLLLFWINLNLLKNKRLYLVLLSGITFGALVSVKISSLMLFPLPLIALFLHERKLLKSIKNAALFMLSALVFYFLTNPYVILDYPSFTSSIRYESAVVLGTTNVFYTEGFFHTIPVIFQFFRIYPFLLNPLLTILFIPAFFYLLYKGIRTKNLTFLLLNSYFLILFLPQSFLFAKWTRYMVPTLPFAYLAISIALLDLLQHSKKVFSIKYLVLTIILFSSTLFGISYFMTAFIKSDTRIEASKFAKNNIKQEAEILSEPYDLGLTPFSFPKIDIFNFYELDNNSPAFTNEKLTSSIQDSDYIILPSQRLLRSRLSNSEQFPKGYRFYSLLINKTASFQKIYQTPCDVFCKITYLNNPLFGFEETSSVFDRPTVMIFKRINL